MRIDLSVVPFYNQRVETLSRLKGKRKSCRVYIALVVNLSIVSTRGSEGSFALGSHLRRLVIDGCASRPMSMCDMDGGGVSAAVVLCLPRPVALTQR